MDPNKQTELFQVPAHPGVGRSDTLHDFKQVSCLVWFFLFVAYLTPNFLWSKETWVFLVDRESWSRSQWFQTSKVQFSSIFLVDFSIPWFLASANEKWLEWLVKVWVLKGLETVASHRNPAFKHNPIRPLRKFASTSSDQICLASSDHCRKYIWRAARRL